MRDRVLVLRRGKGRHGILYKNLLIAQFHRSPGRAFDANICGDARQDDRCYFATPELEVEIGPVKSTPLAFGDNMVRGLDRERRREFAGIGRHFAWGRPRLVARRLQPIFAVAREGNPHPDNESAFRAQGRCQLRGALDDHSGFVRLCGIGHDKILQVNGDEGRLRR